MASCPNHALNAEQHCEEMEKMLEHVPGDFCEGEGDSPSDALRRFREAYDELEADVKDLRDAAVLESFIFRRIEDGKLRISAGDEKEIVQHVTRRCSPRAKATGK
jgi:hypothetical protein